MTKPRADQQGSPYSSLTIGLMILACVAGLASCSGGGEGGGGAGGGHSAEASIDKTKWPKPEIDNGLAKKLALPIEPYLETYPEQVTIQNAKNAVQRDCMKRFGFNFNPPTPGQYPPSAYNAANMKRRYGITDLADAKKIGYRLPEETREDPKPYEPQGAAANFVFDLTVSDGQKPPNGMTYKGVKIPAGGCRGESDRTIGAFDDVLAGKINVNTFLGLKQNPKVLKVNRKWSSCMKRKGYTVGTPLDAIRQAFSDSAGEASPKEISQAVADVECKKSTDLVDVYFSTETEMQKRAIEKEQLTLDEQMSRNSSVVKRAARYS